MSGGREPPPFMFAVEAILGLTAQGKPVTEEAVKAWVATALNNDEARTGSGPGSSRSACWPGRVRSRWPPDRPAAPALGGAASSRRSPPLRELRVNAPFTAGSCSPCQSVAQVRNKGMEPRHE